MNAHMQAKCTISRIALQLRSDKIADCELLRLDRFNIINNRRLMPTFMYLLFSTLIVTRLIVECFLLVSRVYVALQKNDIYIVEDERGREEVLVRALSVRFWVRERKILFSIRRRDVLGYIISNVNTVMCV